VAISSSPGIRVQAVVVRNGRGAQAANPAGALDVLRGSGGEPMPKQSKAQKETVECVMHEFKEGELESGSGAKVRDRRQAIAIALREAGSSNRASPAENREALTKTKRRERKAEQSKAALYAEAKKKGVEGRSRMTKAELARALAG
jgi:hypothetical protein